MLRFLPGALLATVCGLVFVSPAARAQVAPTPAMQPIAASTAFYIDGKPASPAEAAGLQPEAIQSMDVRKDARDKQALGQPQAGSVVLLTTKANANSPAVAAFNKRFLVTPATPAQLAGIAAAQAYVAQHYPAAKLEAASSVPGQPDRYKAIFTDGGQRLQLLFDGQGNPVKH